MYYATKFVSIIWNKFCGKFLSKSLVIKEHYKYITQKNYKELCTKYMFYRSNRDVNSYIRNDCSNNYSIITRQGKMRSTTSKSLTRFSWRERLRE